MAASTSGPSRRIMHCSSDSASIRPDVTGRNPLDFFSLSRTSPAVMLTTSPRPLLRDTSGYTSGTSLRIYYGPLLVRIERAQRRGRRGSESASPHRSYNPTFGGEMSGKEKRHDQEGIDAARYRGLDGGRGERCGDGGDLDG